MSLKPSPQKISEIVQRYIDKFQADKRDRGEYIYFVPPKECAELADFIRDDAARTAFCFYPLSPEKYDKEHDQFMFASYIKPIYQALKNGKLRLDMNIVIPARGREVDRAKLVEILTHELNHAYEFYNELKQGHISSPIGIFATIKDMFDSKNHKYTYTQRMQKYDEVMPIGSGSLYDDFRWVGYFCTETEINANLAGIEAFLYEHKGDLSKLSESRGYQSFVIIRDKLEKIKTQATDDDWQWARKKALYIHNRKDETLGQFKKRYVKYYENMFDKFEKKVEKIKNKIKTDKFKSASNKIAPKPKIIISKDNIR